MESVNEIIINESMRYYAFQFGVGFGLDFVVVIAELLTESDTA